MALVKKSKIVPGASRITTPPASAPPTASVRTATPRASHETVAERIASATEELASGLSESAAATKQLGKSMGVRSPSAPPFFTGPRLTARPRSSADRAVAS